MDTETKSYVLVQSQFKDDFEKQISKLLNEGYELAGALYTKERKSSYAQSLYGERMFDLFQGMIR